MKRIEGGGAQQSQPSTPPAESGSGVASIPPRRVSAPSPTPASSTYLDLKTRVQNRLLANLDPS
ncbi:MAG: CpaF family protein, partial [Anaerolineales bacterium]